MDLIIMNNVAELQGIAYFSLLGPEPKPHQILLYCTILSHMKGVSSGATVHHFFVPDPEPHQNDKVPQHNTD
jgi:hypothetical protein